MGRYYGSKQRIAKQLVKVIMDYVKDKKVDKVIDCFCGTGSVSWTLRQQIDVPIIASDHFEYMIITLKALQSGWVPKKKITHQQFNNLKLNTKHPLHSLVHIGCSWKGQYLRDKYRNPWTNKMLTRLHKTVLNLDLKGIDFQVSDYRDYSYEKNCLIYCDPPYFTSNQKEWPKNYKGFDHKEFWDWVREMSENNIVLVSEFTAPDDFECIWTKHIHVNDNRLSLIKTMKEKLWVIKKDVW